jgi:8-oxo-dGTP diphosphatase
MVSRHRSIVDVHLILRRADRVVMLRRANTSFADGLLCFPSGHLERGESVVDGVIREGREEIGVVVDDRFGFFFEAGRWSGEPVNAEPHKCSELVWVDPRDPPPDVVPYQAVALTCLAGRSRFSLLGWDGGQNG